MSEEFEEGHETEHGGGENSYDNKWVLIWFAFAIYICMAIVATIGNGLVLYAAHIGNNTGRLRYLDGVIKSLAMTDMLFGVIGIPCMLIADYYTGKYDCIFSVELKRIKNNMLLII